LTKILITKEHILNLANQHLNGTSIYVTGIRIGSDNHINVFLDGDEGVTIKDCVTLSRAIEGNLDREKEDYALDVSSHGAATPLVMPRQYKRHLGRTFEVKLQDGTKTEGDLIACDDNEIKLEFTSRENKPVGKGKVTVVKQQVIKFSEIKESRIKLKY
jgi:ribosome maturation factor RimP